MHKEVKQINLSGYCLGSLVENQCLCSWSDYVGVLSKPTGSGATPEMKNYTLKNIKLENNITLLLIQNIVI